MILKYLLFTGLAAVTGVVFMQFTADEGHNKCLRNEKSIRDSLINDSVVNSQTAKLLQVADEYRQYSIWMHTLSGWEVTQINWISGLCRLPTVSDLKLLESLQERTYIMSKAPAMASPHGEKVFKMFVKDMRAYIDTLCRIQPLGQVIVKETWNLKPDSCNACSFEQTMDPSLVLHPLIYNANDHKYYTPTTVSQLFIMYKEDTNAWNDEGWVYGIVDISAPALKTVVQGQGKISTCISCHHENKYDRIFGVK